MKKKYCETLTPGFYLSSDRCIYITGKTKSNKWIYLSSHKPEWCGLMPNAITNDTINNTSYYTYNPTDFKL
jgi:hypothetical protein